MHRQFTGFHAAAILVAFFAVVIAVNLYMARMAVSTFGGVLAKNGYVASQDYNKWVAESEAQEKLGWSVAATVDERHLVIETEGVDAADVTVIAEHPLGRADDQRVAMAPTGPRAYRSVGLLPAGRWKLRILLSKDGREARFLSEVRA